MHPQRAAAAAFLVLSTVYIALAFRLEEVATASASAIGPRGFPLLVGALGVAISLLLLAAPARASHDALPGTPRTGDGGTEARGVLAGDWRRTLALCGLTLLYAAALPILGFTLATAGFLAASFRLLGERRPFTLVVVPLAIAIVTLAILRGALGAHLPEPLLEAALSLVARP